MQNYANNPKNRNKFLANQLMDNPFSIDTDIQKESKNNNTLVIDSLLDSLNMELTEEDYGEDEIPEISELDPGELEELLEHFEDNENVSPKQVKNWINNR